MLPNSNAVPGVFGDFSQLGGFSQSQVNPTTNSGTLRVLDLENTICVAAQNSRTAQLLQSQLLKLQSTPNVKCPSSLNLAIQAEIAEERSQAASLAGQAFLGLVELELQRNLLLEAQQKLIEINTTITQADDEGFATAQAKEIVEKQSIEIASKESALNFNTQKLESQLKALLSLPSSDTIELSYQLVPAAITLDTESEKSKANQQRPELVAIQQTLSQWNECSAESAKSILSAADPRMGLELAKVVLKKRWPLLARFRQQEPESDPCESQLLRQQTENLLADSQTLIALEVEQAIFETQFGYESMVLANEEIERLENKIEQIKAKKDLNATEAYIDLQNNWYETLLARSNRVKKAIEFESAQIRLAHATGELLQICGAAGFCEAGL